MHHTDRFVLLNLRAEAVTLVLEGIWVTVRAEPKKPKGRIEVAWVAVNVTGLK